MVAMALTFLLIILSLTCLKHSESFLKRHISHTIMNMGEFVRNPVPTTLLSSTNAPSSVPLPNPHFGRIISISDIPKTIKSLKSITSIGNPKVIPPGGLGSEWLLWHHVRDETIDDSVLKLSTGKILFATSANGLTNWKYTEEPCLSPAKETGDWFLFDSEHVGVGDVCEPGQVAQSKFKTQEGVILMYIFGGNGETKSLPGVNNEESTTQIKGMKMEIGVAVSQDGGKYHRIL